MMRIGLLAGLALVLAGPQVASAQRATYESMVATHAAANGVPEALVHRVIVRESGYRPHLISRGNIGMMQIKLATARGLGYTGTAEGLLDPQTNLTWAVKYLAGAWKVAKGDANRAVHYYAAGYYYAAKREMHQALALGAAVPRIRRGKPALAPPRLDELTSATAETDAKQ